MKQVNLYFPIALLTLGLVLISCSTSKKTESNRQELITENNVTENNSQVEQISVDDFTLPDIPSEITNSDLRAQYLVKHYWDHFSFRNRELIGRPEITEQAFVDYINILNYVPNYKVDESIRETIKKAEVDTLMHAHFISLFEKYFYDPNSPFRNEELYIPVLNQITKSSLLTDTDKSVYEFQLEMAMKNRVGKKGNNFKYTLASGKTFSFYELKSEYTLLMFSNPGCPTCETVTRQLSSSEPIKNALTLNSSTRTMLTIITLYPDENLDEWLAHLPQMPANWVHAYDKDLEITHKNLYDIKAIPTLYLFDNDKNVILKDTSIEAIENFFNN